MTYEKKYKEALEKARQLCVYPTSKPFISDLQDLFPELKESEDEQIRKGIIHNLKYLANKAQGFVKDELEERIAWLEKQIPVDEEKVLMGAKKDIALSIMNFFDKNTLGMGLSNMEFEDLEEAVVDSDWLKVYRYMKKKIEKQSESKPQGKTALEAIKEEKADNANKVEPKFHEGDWVVSPNGVYWHIDKISNNRYEVTSNTGESSNWNLDTNIYHKFTIQDAKDGDVLATEPIKDYPSPFVAIYKEHGLDFFNSYCFIGFDGNFYEGEVGHDIECIHPATKEQRERFFAAMHDAGYEWDAEKKELKLLITNGGDFESENCGQKPTAWSEEDETGLTNTIIMLKEGASLHFNKKDITKAIDWLKSLRPQKQWKPTEEQMDALETAVSSLQSNTLETLYQDLKRENNYANH